MASENLTDRKGSEVYTEQLGGGLVIRDAAFWRAVQAVIARGATLWGEGLVGYPLQALSRDLKQIKLLAPGSPLLCPKAVAYEVIDNFFFFDDSETRENQHQKTQALTALKGTVPQTAPSPEKLEKFGITRPADISSR